MKRLHILRKTRNPGAETLIKYQVEKGEEVEIVLIQDAVFLNTPFIGPKVFACLEDVEARGHTRQTPTIDYPGMIEKIMASDSVVCW